MQPSVWSILLSWGPMIPLAIANGFVREKFLAAQLGELRAHQLSTLTALLLFAIYIDCLARFWPQPNARAAWLLGLGWVGLTIAFELLFGRYAAGHSWRRLLHDYNLAAGRIWILVPAWLAVAPYLFHRCHS